MSGASVQALGGHEAVLARACVDAVEALFAHPEAVATQERLRGMARALAAAIAERRANFHAIASAIEACPSGQRAAGHSARTAAISVGIGVQLGLSAAYLEKLCEGALCHDIGQALVPPDIMQKAGPLTEVEWRLLRQHPRVGVDLLSAHGPLSAIVRDAILTHHEQLDGGGYPFGLEGAEVPLPGRIVGLADRYEALSRDRPDRPGLRSFEAVEAIAEHAAGAVDRDLFRELLVLLARSEPSW